MSIDDAISEAKLEAAQCSYLATHRGHRPNLARLVSRYYTRLNGIREGERGVCPRNLSKLMLFYLRNGASSSDIRAGFTVDPSFLSIEYVESRFEGVLGLLRELCSSNEVAVRGMVRRCPSMFSRSETELRRTLQCLRSLGLDTQAVIDNPKYLAVEDMEAKVDFLCSHGISKEVLGKNKWHFLLGLSLDKVLKPKVELLTRNSIQGKVLSRLVFKYPWVLNSHNLSVEVGAPAFDEAGIRGDEFARMVAWYPGTLKAAKSLTAREEFLGQAGIKKHTNIYNSALKIASSVNPAALEGRLSRLARYGFSGGEAVDVFKKQPRTLLLSDEFLDRKMAFLQRRVKLPKERLLSSPNYLIYSLDKRLAPRLQIVALLRLHGMLRTTPRWKRWFYATNAEFATYVESWHPQAAGIVAGMLGTAKKGS